ncbi:hypothetical protein MRX96_012825 [Rhipicephalus microplus]
MSRCTVLDDTLVKTSWWGVGDRYATPETTRRRFEVVVPARPRRPSFSRRQPDTCEDDAPSEPTGTPPVHACQTRSTSTSTRSRLTTAACRPILA